MAADLKFWNSIDTLLETSERIIDRPKGSSHPKYPDFIYPVDYGYLKGTSSMDGSGIDIWIGSEDTDKVTGIICTVDLLKRDSEMKILIACTQTETDRILNVLNDGCMSAVLITKRSDFPIKRKNDDL